MFSLILKLQYNNIKQTVIFIIQNDNGKDNLCIGKFDVELKKENIINNKYYINHTKGIYFELNNNSDLRIYNHSRKHPLMYGINIDNKTQKQFQNEFNRFYNQNIFN